MQFTDKTLVCVECGSEFAFTASEQEFHASKGFGHEPKRCLSCRQARRARKTNGNTEKKTAQREYYDAVCVVCGADTQVPFLPEGNRPVCCSGCYSKLRAIGRGG